MFFKKKKEKEDNILLFDSEDRFDYVLGYRSFDFKSYTKAFNTVFITDGYALNERREKEVCLDSNIVSVIRSRKFDRVDLRSVMFQDANYVVRVSKMLKNNNYDMDNEIVDVKVFLKDKNNSEVLFVVDDIIEMIRSGNLIIDNKASCITYKNKIKCRR